jgi:hypothetical protein
MPIFGAGSATAGLSNYTGGGATRALEHGRQQQQGKTPQDMRAAAGAAFGSPSSGQTATQQPPPGVLPGVQGAQYAAPGSSGVTSYGLFSRRAPPPTYSGPTRPSPQPTRPGIMPPQIGRVNPGARLPPGVGITNPPRPPTLAPGTPARAGAQVSNPFMAQRMSAMQAQAPRQPGVINQTPTAPQLAGPTNMQMNAMMASPADALAELAQQPWLQGTPIGAIGNLWGQVGGGQSPTEAAGGVAADAAGLAGGTLGAGFAEFRDAWDAATGGGSNASAFDFMQIPGFEQSSLMGDVGQNMTSMMDPAAWEQMAANRLSSAFEANRGALNLGERRLNDRAARTGLANSDGARGSMYDAFAQRNMQAERDIFNDTLNNQMGAIGQAGNFALGQQAQDQARWSQLLGLGGQAGLADFMANREDNPSGAAVLQDLLGALGGLAGAGGQGASGLMSLLGPLLLV